MSKWNPADHLPECLRIVGNKSGPCICWLLRHCEQRVRAKCISTVRERRDELVAQIASRPVQTRSLASAIYEDAIAALREEKP